MSLQFLTQRERVTVHTYYRTFDYIDEPGAGRRLRPRARISSAA